MPGLVLARWWCERGVGVRVVLSVTGNGAAPISVEPDVIGKDDASACPLLALRLGVGEGSFDTSLTLLLLAEL